MDLNGNKSEIYQIFEKIENSLSKIVIADVIEKLFDFNKIMWIQQKNNIKV